MSDDHYRREFLCEFVEPTTRERTALRLWCEYYARTEAFDRTMCARHAQDGTAIPMWAEERWASSHNAQVVLRDIEMRLISAGVTHEESTAAKRHACALSYEDQCRIAKEGE